MINSEADPGLILALHRATHATLHALAGRLVALGLGSAEINVLAVLADGRDRNVGALAAATATKAGTLTSVLDRLAGKGYVSRELDPGDRRSFLVSLTPRGREAADAVRAAIADLEQAARSMVRAADLAGFHAVAGALAEASQ